MASRRRALRVEAQREQRHQRVKRPVLLQSALDSASASSSPSTKPSLSTFGTRPSSATSPTTRAAEAFEAFGLKERRSSSAPASSREDGEAMSALTNSVFALGLSPPKVQAGRRGMCARSRRQRNPSTEVPSLAHRSSAPPPTKGPAFTFGVQPSLSTPSSPAPATRFVNTFVFGEGFAPISSGKPQHVPAHGPSGMRTRRPAPLAKFAGPQWQKFGLGASVLFFTQTRSLISLLGVEEVKHAMQSQSSRASSLASSTSLPLSKEMQGVLVTAATAIRESIVAVAHLPVALSPSLFDTTACRWANAIANKGFPSIDFIGSRCDSRSAEACPRKTARSLDIDISSNIGALLAVLPLKLGVQLSAYMGEFLVEVTDICLGIGCEPTIVMYGKHTKLFGGTPMTQSELECVVHEAQRHSVREVSDRVTMDSLHRLGILRSTLTGEGISAVTLRVGRAVHNQAMLLKDLLFASSDENKSVLMLGLPGSGKTTLLRDIALCLSGKQDAVYVVDTWSELSGGANGREHIGSSTRHVVVTSRDQQAEAIRACVRNHGVRMLVVDEVESEGELMALWSAKERGVRLIVGVQGSVATLVQLTETSGRVLRTAVTQRMLGCEHLLAERGRSLFGSLVELDAASFTTVKVTKRFAREEWEEDLPASESRCYNSSTGAICINANYT